MRLFSTAFLLLVSACSTVSADTPPEGSPPPSNACYEYGAYPVGAKVYPLLDTASIVAEPTLKAKPLAKISLADGPLVILEKTEKSASVYGVRDDFYKVRSGSGPHGLTGYVYGGFLAKSALETDLDGDGAKESVRIGWGSRGRMPRTSDLPQAVAAIIKGGKIIASVPFEPIGLVEGGRFSYTIRSKALGSEGLSGGVRLIRVRFEYGACDYPSGDVLLTYAQGKLRVGLRATESGNEQGSQTFRYIFPRDKGGKPDRVIVVSTTEQFNDKGKIAHHSAERRTYRWAGGALEETTPG